MSAALIAAPSAAEAQSTLVVRRAAQGHPTIEAALDEVLRAELGSSARRVEISLGDLALAAGCGAAIEAPDCIAAIARAASADLVAVEHVRRDGERYEVHIVLYGSDGARLRAIDTDCMPGHCGDALATAVHGGGGAPMEEPVPTPEPSDAPSADEDVLVVASSTAEPRTVRARETSTSAAAATTTATTSAASGPAETSRTDTSSGFEVRASTVMYTGAAITGLGAIISGIVSSDASSRAAGLGVVRTREDADTLIAAEHTRDGALVTGVVLAIAGAGLAVTGVVLQTTEHDVRVTTLPTAGGAMVLCGGTF